MSTRYALRVLDLFRDREPHTLAQVIHVAGGTPSKASTVLRELTQSGAIVRSGHEWRSAASEAVAISFAPKG